MSTRVARYGGLVGPRGGGTGTLLKILATLLLPGAGTASVEARASARRAGTGVQS